MNIGQERTTRRGFCLSIMAGAATGLFQESLRAETDPTVIDKPATTGREVLCRNPAYRLGTDKGQDCLTTMNKQRQIIRFAVDSGGKAVWEALSGPDEIEKGRGRTVDQVVDAVAIAFPHLASSQARQGVLAFLDQAKAAGVVLPSDKNIFCRARASQNVPEKATDESPPRR